MARKESIEKPKYRNSIIKKSLQLIEQDPQSLTVRKLAELSNISVGSVYNIFKNFDELTLHIKAAVLNQLHSELSLALKDASHNTIDILAKAFYKFTHANKNLWCFVMQTKHNTPFIPEWYVTHVNNIFTLIETELKKIPNIRQDHLKTSAILLWSGLQGLSTIKEEEKLDLFPTITFEQLIDAFIKQFLSGLPKIATAPTSHTASVPQP